jgi:hypothetical protein
MAERRQAAVTVADGLVAAGVVCVGAAAWLAVGWAGLLGVAGVLLIVVGVAEAKRRIRRGTLD